MGSRMNCWEVNQDEKLYIGVNKITGWIAERSFRAIKLYIKVNGQQDELLRGQSG